MKFNKSFENTYENRCAQFLRDQEKCKKSAIVAANTPATTTISKKDVTLQDAWDTIFKKLPDFQQKEILAMKTGKLPQNRFYDEFISQVAAEYTL